MTHEIIRKMLELCEEHMNEGEYLESTNLLKEVHKNQVNISIIDDRVVKTLTNPIRIMYNNAGYFDVTAYSWTSLDNFFEIIFFTSNIYVGNKIS